MLGLTRVVLVGKRLKGIVQDIDRLLLHDHDHIHGHDIPWEWEKDDYQMQVPERVGLVVLCLHDQRSLLLLM
jgi:hypothetical protein